MTERDFFADRGDPIIFSLQSLFYLKQKSLTNVVYFLVFILFFTIEEAVIPLQCEELYYVLITQNYQPALNSSRLHCLHLTWLI